MKAVRCFYCGMLVKLAGEPTTRYVVPANHHPQEGEDGFATLSDAPACEGFRFNGSVEEVEVDESGNVIF